jgi:hypothetical protein
MPFKYVRRVGVCLHPFVITALVPVALSPGKNPGAVGIEVGVRPRVGLDVFAPTSTFRPRMVHSLV